ncbi:ATP-binding subunit of chaperone [Weissella oryzae SG25]|uniref:ATP-binding subunit of chaperone n=1 Tax=Weissella oryzae (strain DSM 25784 / JCM 18191 / LMG 30913 / SG25) TaxID=1329250 RepID=A0A069CW02_WEIOS|nr:ATP-dependent Clp protease ATP-binding subunit [Weissella oryzae]GAK31393.1 ATP-binding subunit of chaperone [Weissella oryzae SG25]
MAQDPFAFSNFDDIFRMMNSDAARMQQAERERMLQAQAMQQQQQAKGQATGNEQGNLLEQFGINLTQLAREGKFDPVIGRDNEIKRVIEVLNRRTKNNPVLIGEAGVGKTAVVEGLAQAIVDGSVPAKLANKEVIRLDVVSLVQGTGVRGQFEERMQQLMKEVTQRADVILFIDEIHEIMGAGTAGEGSLDAGNILKPALARGEFQLIGATTLSEYRQIEKDAAIARRFQTIQVNEPTAAEALLILQGIRARYEAYHQVHYADDALAAAVNLSSRYIQERFLPDKAIDLLDEAGSRKNLTLKVANPEDLKQQIHNAEAQKQSAVEHEAFERASKLRDEINRLELQLEAIEQQAPQKIDAAMVTVADIQKIVEERTGIPVGDLQAAEQSQLQNLADNLAQHVIGQSEATNKVARAIRRNRVGFNKTGRPIGSFLFVGPTGVGKTETAKQLAKELFGTADNMIRFDMSEYMEKHSVSKLIGAPAGYVGYEEAGQLTEAVRRHPYSLILLDEVEKAHPDVMNMFLQILDDGRLTDAQGRTVSFKDTIIIMTSNAGTGVQSPKVGFEAEKVATDKQSKADVLHRLAPYFRPEFLNRFDGIIQFNPLNKRDLLNITSLMLADMNKTVAEHGLQVTVSKAAEERLVELGYDPNMGARPLRRVIQEQLEDQIADFYLDHPTQKALVADLEDNKITIKAAKPAVTKVKAS